MATSCRSGSSFPTGKGLTALKGLKKLEYLDVGGTKVTKKGIAALQKALPKLDMDLLKP